MEGEGCKERRRLEKGECVGCLFSILQQAILSGIPTTLDREIDI